MKFVRYSMERQLQITKGDKPDELIMAVREMVNTYGTVRVDIKPIYADRTLKQNSYFHMYVKRIAHQSGLDAHENGIQFLKAKLKERAVEMGYPPEVDSEGRVQYERITYLGDNYSFIRGKSSSKASIAEMKLLIQACDELAQEYGYVLENQQY